MAFKLGIVGHQKSIEDISIIARKNFIGVDIYSVEFNNDQNLDVALSKFKKILNICDGILFTRIDPYKLLSSKIDIPIPFRYAQITTSHFIRALLKAKLLTGCDPYNISIDTIPYQYVINAYGTLDIDKSELSIGYVSIDDSIDNYISRAEEEHLKNYTHNLCSFCITSIRQVHINLTAKGIPCTLMMPDEETYLYELKNLILLHKMRMKEKNETVILYISLNKKDEFYIINDTQLQDILETNRASEYIAIFCEKLDGALIHMGFNKYVLLCSNKNLELITDNFKKFELLSTIPTHTDYNVSIGVGYGDSLKESRSNSILGLNKAILELGSKAYIVYDSQRVVGPIEYDIKSLADKTIYEDRLILVAKKTGLSINTVYKIDCLIKQKHTRNFTSKELANLLGVSQRTVNRMLIKLENCGYIAEVGKHVVGVKGRPSRIVKITY